MDNSNDDMEYINSLAAKYKKTSITKKEIYTLLAVLLLLGGVAFYQTVNALTLQITNIQLERTLAEYSKPAQDQSLVNELPTPYFSQNTSFDFSKALPDLNHTNKAPQTTELEIPPTVKNNQVDNVIFAGKKYAF